MTAATVDRATDPKYIKYLLNPLEDYSCYITVGNASIAPLEKIGVVPKMLFAHSEVMRTDLQVKNIKDKVPYEIEDILPDTFKNLLRFMYGYDTSSTLSFDEADNLLYAAEKYMVSDLKNSLVLRLMSLLNSDNICSLMNNRVCYEVLELNASINKILQTETRKVFASPDFLELTSDAFVKILEQEVLNVKEVDIWRKALLWAKHQAKAEDGDSMRKVLRKPLKHIRLCSLSTEDLWTEVVPTKVLSPEEVVDICVATGSKQKPTTLTEICTEVEVRKEPQSTSKSTIMKKEFFLTFCYTTMNCSFKINNRNLKLELVSLTVLETQYSSCNHLRFNFVVYVEQVGAPESRVSVFYSGHNL